MSRSEARRLAVQREAEHPILFSGPLVRQILAGKKWQTRRLVKPMRGRQAEWLTEASITASPKLTIARTSEGKLGAAMEHPMGGPGGWIACPYGEPGASRLWVRETWRTEELSDGLDGIRFRADDAFVPIECTPEAADLWVDAHENGRHGSKWRPSIFMRRWACRIVRPLLDVRVERVQDISDENIVAEGVTREVVAEMLAMPLGHIPDLRTAWQFGWTHINGAASWKSNPWTWALSFPRTEASHG